MFIDCPKCSFTNQIDGDDLPQLACDDEDYECVECEHVFSIGWTAEVEIRDYKLEEAGK